MTDILNEFLSEGMETVTGLERDLGLLRGSPADPEVVARLYRAVHTIKGACGFLGLAKLEGLTASGELLLGRLQSGKLQLDREKLEVLGEMGAAVHRLLDHLASAGSEDEVDDSALLGRLEILAEPVEDA